MTDSTDRPPVSIGEPAPPFVLPAVGREGTVSLQDYRGRSAVFLALFRGLYCPFCRRAIAQLGMATDKLKGLGVETLGVVATNPDNASLYFRFRPTRAPLAADPELSTHRAYRLPRPPVTPELMNAIASVRVNPTGELPEPLPIVEAASALDKVHGFTPTETDRRESQQHFPQLVGEFLIDRDGIVRWARIETATEGVAGFGKFPTDDELVGAARGLSR
jgi:peroxiredoxin